jgi:GTPase SAR1 family protein
MITYADVCRRKSFKLLMVGPDGGGKSSLLFCWKANQALAEAQVALIEP